MLKVPSWAHPSRICFRNTYFTLPRQLNVVLFHVILNLYSRLKLLNELHLLILQILHPLEFLQDVLLYALVPLSVLVRQLLSQGLRLSLPQVKVANKARVNIGEHFLFPIQFLAILPLHNFSIAFEDLNHFQSR